MLTTFAHAQTNRRASLVSALGALVFSRKNGYEGGSGQRALMIVFSKSTLVQVMAWCHQATNVDPVLCRHMAALGYNELIRLRLINYQIMLCLHIHGSHTDTTKFLSVAHNTLWCLYVLWMSMYILWFANHYHHLCHHEGCAEIDNRH